MRYTKKAYTENDIEALAQSAVRHIFKGMDDTDFVSAVMTRYAHVWSEVLDGNGYPQRSFSDDDKLRMRFEVAYFAVMLSGLYLADEYLWRKGWLLPKREPNAALSFKVHLLRAFAAFLNENGFSGLRELQGVQFEPEIVFSPGSYIDVQSRFEEYMDAHQKQSGGELRVFIKYMAVAVDAPHYPFHEPWVGQFGIAVRTLAKDSFLHALADLGFVKS